MRIWVDDMRPMPKEYDVHCKSVWETIICIFEATARGEKIELISLDHDAGAEYVYGGDYIHILHYLEWLFVEKGETICTNFHFHTANSVGAQNMRSIITSCGWKEVK